jgi:hypothetical protein
MQGASVFVIVGIVLGIMAIVLNNARLAGAGVVFLGLGSVG